MEILKTVDRKFRANDQRVGKVIKKFEDGLSIEQLEEISSKLKQMTPSELRELHYLRSDLVQNEQTGGKGKPVMILFRTEMGHGVDFMAGTHKWHGKNPSPEQCEAAMAQLPETLGDF